jgi:elongator complex protein 1
MASYTLTLPSTPVHVAMSHTTDSLAILYANGLVQTWELNTKVPDGKGSKLRGGGKVAEPKLASEMTVDLGSMVGTALTVGSGGEYAVLARGLKTSTIIASTAGKEPVSHAVESDVERVLYGPNGRLISVTKAGTFATGQ